MEKLTAKLVGGYNRQDLRVYGDGYLLYSMTVDRTYYGPEWCKKHGMVIADTVEADNGETFNIWRKADELICAIPVKK